jgi:2-desacetyl-2-hydroxyethyl bacteriochlorophyllide A dehydrogenase
MNASSMQAIMITGPGTLEVRTILRPDPGPGEILVRTAFAGVCGTDAHLLEGHSFYLENGYVNYPFVFGHEYSGTVVATGLGVRSIAVGARVAGHCMVPCHACDHCQRGRRNLCRHLSEVGLRFIQGAAAEYVCVPHEAVTVIPDSLSLQTAAMVEPSVAAYHATCRTGIQPSDRVAIIGTGTLGLLALLMARLSAGSVDVVGSSEAGRALATELGADRVLRPEDARASRYDVVIEAAGSNSTLGLALEIADLGARVASIGIPPDAYISVSQADIVLKNLTVHGILHGIDQYPEVVGLFASGLVDPTPLIAGTVEPSEAATLFDGAALAANGRTKPKTHIRF